MVFSGQQDNAQAAVGAPSPDALLPTLDERKLAVLRQVGQEWNRLTGDPQAWQRALPVDPNLGGSPDAAELRPTRFGRFVPLSALDGQPPAIEATAEAEEPPSQPGRLAYQLRRIMLGPPLDAPRSQSSGSASWSRYPYCPPTHSPRSPTDPRPCSPSWSSAAAPRSVTRCR